MKSSNLEPNKEDACLRCDISQVAFTEDSESFLEDYGKYKKEKLAQNSKPQTSNKNIEVANVKQLPTLFFIIFIVVLAMVTTKFVPQMLAMGMNHKLYIDKLSIKYVAECFGDLSLTVKVIYW